MLKKDDIEFLISLLPDWTKEVPKGLDPTFYGTGRYETDLEIKQRIDRIKRTLLKPDKTGIRVDDLGDRYLILHMGVFSQSIPSKELILDKKDFDSLYEQMKKIKEPNGFSISK